MDQRVEALLHDIGGPAGVRRERSGRRARPPSSPSPLSATKVTRRRRLRLR
jgi:hypothetical protein